MISLHSRLFPGVLRGKTTSSCKLMICVWISLLLASCWLFWQKGACMTKSAARAEKGSLTLLQRTIMHTDFHIWSHWWQTPYKLCCLALFSALKSAHSYHSLCSHRHAGTFMFHVSDDRRHAKHSPLHRFPHGTRDSFYVAFLTRTHTQRCTFIRQTHAMYRHSTCWPRCFS